MRPIHLVVAAIKKIVPEDFGNRAELFARIDDIVDSSAYTAPELMSMRWQQLGVTLADLIGDADTEWNDTIKKLMRSEIHYQEFLGS